MRTFARVQWGMQRAEFDRLTLREWAALREREQERREHRDELTEFMLAQLTATVANTAFRYAKEWQQPREYMPSWHREEARRAASETQEEIADRLRNQMHAIMRSFVSGPADGYELAAGEAGPVPAAGGRAG